MTNDNILPRFFVSAGVLIWRNDQILLVKKNYGDKNWTLPGGLMEKGEAINQTAVREVKEEIGVDVRLTRIVGIYSIKSRFAITFEGELVDESFSLNGDEISDCAYFALDDLPKSLPVHLVQRIRDFDQKKMDITIRHQNRQY